MDKGIHFSYLVNLEKEGLVKYILYYDYNLSQYISEYDPWKVDMLECIDIYMYRNNYLKVPKLWWYTFKGLEENTIVGIYKTNTVVSNIIILPYRNNYVRNLITT